MAELVVLSGLPGVGKSSIARALAAARGLLWLRVDAIEQAMWDSHLAAALDKAGDLADGGYAAMRAVAEGALAQGLGVVADAVNPIEITRAPWRRIAARRAVRLCAVDVVCSDRAEHRARVEARRNAVPTQDDGLAVPGLALPDWAAVEAREYAPWRGAMQIDTGLLSLSEAVAAIGRRLDELESGE